MTAFGWDRASLYRQVIARWLSLGPTHKNPAVPWSYCEKQKNCLPSAHPPTITAMPRASSVLAEWLKMQVALRTCFSCFWNWPNSPRSKKISREQVQTFLLGDHGFSSLTNLQGPREISWLVPPFVWSSVMSPMHSITGDSQLPKEMTVLCELRGEAWPRP